MKTINLLLLILLVSLPVVSQTADEIIKKNLFDPQRGQAETVEDASEPVEEALPKDIPILDGIVTIGSYQRAIFRYRDENSHKVISGSFKTGDNCTTAKIVQILPEEVTIVFEGKKYKMNVDSKNKMKNVPKTSGAYGGGVARAEASHAGPQVVERKVTAPRRNPAVRRQPEKSGAVRRGGASTPFGSSRAAGKAKKEPKKARKSTPF
ncbi:MAG: hypothetical protein CO090_06835 [Acidobacteria bacterium CG_4_9_14_3_um_filter_49_7]|nr:MAG: hypothetical protein CO090_06835 [Acidobacteria bacterium CG_4_9_14_3_um_filter_49_7]